MIGLSTYAYLYSFVYVVAVISFDIVEVRDLDMFN